MENKTGTETSDLLEQNDEDRLQPAEEPEEEHLKPPFGLGDISTTDLTAIAVLVTITYLLLTYAQNSLPKSGLNVSSTITIPLQSSTTVTTIPRPASPTGYLYCVEPFTPKNVSARAVTYAPLYANGTAGLWIENASPLSPLLVETSCVTANNNLYCIGGSLHAITYTNMVRYAHLTPTITNWNITTPYPLDAITRCIAYNNYIYCIGAYNAQLELGSHVYRDKVYYTKTTANGVTGWLPTTDYPASPFTLPACTAYSNYIYCVGGENVGAGSTTIYTNKTFYASINSNGSLSSWKEGTSYPLKVEATSCAAYSGSGYGAHLYCLGGDGTNASYYAQTVGNIGPWKKTKSYPTNTAVSHLSCNAHDGYMYCAGGFNASSSTMNSTYRAFINSSIVPNVGNGDLGPWIEGTSLPASPQLSYSPSCAIN